MKLTTQQTKSINSVNPEIIGIIKEIEKYPKPQNESAVLGYCIKAIEGNINLTKYERQHFTNHLSRIMLEEELKGILSQLGQQLKLVCKEIEFLDDENLIHLESLKEKHRNDEDFWKAVDICIIVEKRRNEERVKELTEQKSDIETTIKVLEEVLK
jgi:hypothetical protein